VTLLVALVGLPAVAAAHVIIDPADSPTGATQLYTVVVPSEKRVDTVKVEVQFPRTLVVLNVQAPPGWTVTPEKDASGRILGALWEGGRSGPDEFASFGVLSQNPRDAADLTWTAIQTYADGSEVQWVGNESSQFPAGVTHVRDAAPVTSAATVLAGAALVVALCGLGVALAVWRRRPRQTAEVDTPTPDAAPAQAFTDALR
jgi:uncharacterized protein YcnI